MSLVATTAIADDYSAKFDNYADVAHPAVFGEAAFGVLMQKAIDRNSPLTREEVENEFGELGWEE
jgi:hypothetical protein